MAVEYEAVERSKRLAELLDCVAVYIFYFAAGIADRVMVVALRLAQHIGSLALRIAPRGNFAFGLETLERAVDRRQGDARAGLA